MKIRWMAALTCLCLLATAANAQNLLNKLKQKAGSKLDQKINQKVNQKLGLPGSQNQTNDPNNPNNTNQGNNPNNKGGAGLISTPPNVNQNLTDAETAYKSGKYGEARYAVQQAMLGVEMEIGNKILKSLPETITGLKKDAASDQVASMGWGWQGLTIQRTYGDGADKQLRVTVANNSAWMSAINMYLTNSAYAQAGGEQNWKQTKVKGYRAIIEFSESSGYKISVPVGQSSLVIFEGVNFATEPEMMSSAEVLDLDGIKKMLGEQ